MAMADMRPTRTSPGSRRVGFPSLQNYVSVPPMSGMRPDNYASPSSALSQTSNVSPTLERRVQERGFPTLSTSISDPAYVGSDSRGQASIRFRKLPKNFDISILRNILAFSDPKDCYLLSTEDGYSDAIATFSTTSQACDAQQRLNGKALPENGAKMVVDVMNDDDPLTSRRNTIDGNNAKLQSTSASSSASSSTTANNNNPMPRHNSRFSFHYTGIHEASPTVRSPGANSASLHSLFLPTSPVANGNSTNSLRQDALGDEEAVQLLSETHPHGRNGNYSTPHRSSDQGMVSSFGALSIQTNMSNGRGGAVMSPGSAVMSPSDQGVGSARSFSAAQGSPMMNPAGNMTNVPVNGNWTFTRPRQSMPPANPADQNPPCNTLYVGNLPPNTCEDELKALFSRQRGYKRLCFRTKHNGPMCFVEFDDINYAAQTLDNLYGTMLTNSIKGGIRLSFSKNPLGVRQGALSSPNSPLGGPGLGTGSSNGGGASFATANGPPPGLSGPYGRPTQGGFGNNHNSTANRSFVNGTVSPPGGLASPAYNQTNHGGWNGGVTGINNRQQALRPYQGSSNGSFGSMMNGA